MGYSESICFSAVPAEALNQKAFLLNRSLFLFAYYEPKPYYEKESCRSKFITAVTNLYGLFWDCGPFFFDLLKSSDSILIHDWNRISWNATQLEKGISAFRTIFCHNCSDQFPLSEEKIENARFWASRYTYGWQRIIEISDEDWEKMLAGLVSETDSLLCDIDNALDGLDSTPDTSRRERAIERWIQQIALGYRRNPDYLLNTMVGLHELYLTNTKQNFMQNKRRDTITWLCNLENRDRKSWYSKWLQPLESGIVNTNIYAILKDWPSKWAAWNNCSVDNCNEAPMPASEFFSILASDIVRFARNPWIIRSN